MASNQLRYITIAKEAGYNDPDDASIGSDYPGEVESENFQQSFDLLKRNDMNYYGARKAAVSKKFSEGSFTCALQPDTFVLMALHGIMGVDTPSTDSGTTPVSDERRFTELAYTGNTELTSYTFKIGRDGGQHVFSGQVIESISVSANVGEYAMLTVNTVGAAQHDSDESLTLDSTTMPSYTGDAAHFVNAFVRFENTAGHTANNYSQLVQSIEFEIKTNRDVDNSYGLGDETCVRAPPVTLREVTGTITFHKNLLTGDATDGEPYFEELMSATSANGNALFDPSGANTPALSALFRVDADHFIRFDFPRVHYEMPETSLSGRDSQTMSVNFHALYQEVSGSRSGMVEITCKSSAGKTDFDA